MISPGRICFSAAPEFGIDAGHDDAGGDAGLDRIFLPRAVVEAGELHPERLLDRARDGRLVRVVGLGRLLGLLLLIVLKAAELDRLGDLLALPQQDDLDVLADRGRGDDLRQIMRFLDLDAIEFQDDVAGLQGRPPWPDHYRRCRRRGRRAPNRD